MLMNGPIEPIYRHAGQGEGLALGSKEGGNSVSLNDKRHHRGKDIPSSDLQAVFDKQDSKGPQAEEVL